MGTLYSLVMMATYAQGYVFVLIGTIVLLNLTILKHTYLRKEQRTKIIENFYNHQKETGTIETNAIFLNALFTSWVSPCTVWMSNVLYKSKFLFISTLVTFSVNLFNLISLYLISNSDMLHNIENPPILHCFHSYNNISNISYNYYYSTNLSKRMINICKNNDNCLPLIRICSEHEMPHTLMYTYIIPIGILFLCISFSASLCLQMLSNYAKMYALLKTICLECPKTFYWLVIDFVFNYNELGENLRKQVLHKLEKEVTKNVSNQEFSMNFFFQHYDCFERSEETLSLYSKLEEISKENNAEEIQQVVWELPPMHAAVENNKLGLWCIMYILGGEAGALNGQKKSSINLIIEKSKIDEEVLESCNSVSRYLIKTATEVYGEYALHRSIKLGDIHLMKILIGNGYDIDESDNHNKNPLLLALEIQNVDFLKLLLQHEATVKEEHIEVASALKSYNYLQILLQPTVTNTKLNKTRNTVLLSTAISGNLHLLKVLIENSADVNSKDKGGQTPLHKSAENGHLECLKYLIEIKANPNAEDKHSQTPVHKSAENGHLECLKYLIESKADVNAKDDKGQTPLYKSAEKGHLELMKCLIENKGDVNAKDDEGQTPLHKSARAGHLECCKYLFDKKADVNAKDLFDQTPLHNSALKGQLECLKYLIDNNAEVNRKDKVGQTPLHKSASAGHLKCCKYLLDNKADVNAKDQNGQTPIHIFATSGHLKRIYYFINNKTEVNVKDKDGQTPLHKSAEKGHHECIRYLIDNNADVNRKDKVGQTPLHKSASAGHLKCCKYLLDNKADVNAKDQNGQTPIHISATSGHLECIHYFINNKTEVNVKDKDDQTPLHKSAGKGHLECIRYLINNKADLNPKDKYGQTPLHKLARTGHLECIKYLRENNADVNILDLEQNTPLHLIGEDYFARYNKPIQSAEYLIKAGADLNAVNVNGATPLANCIVSLLKKRKPELFV